MKNEKPSLVLVGVGTVVIMNAEGRIQSKSANQSWPGGTDAMRRYRDNYDAIFGKKSEKSADLN